MRLCGPAIGPSVHDVNVATPCASVLTVAGAATPLPVTGVKFTRALAITLPAASASRTEGATGTCVVTTAVCASPARIVRFAPVPATIANAPLVTLGVPTLDATSV